MSTPNPLHSRMTPTIRPKIKLKLLYELNGNSCLTRTQVPVDVFTTNDIAFTNFNQCFSAINSASPEILATASNTDYAVYVADCTEADEPMVGRGLLSQLLARPEVDIYNTANLLTGGVVSGRITSSLLSFIPGQAQETVEIRLRFVTIQKASQIASLMSMFLYSSIRKTLKEEQISHICDGRWISELQEQGIWDQLLEFKKTILSEEDNGGFRRLPSPKKTMSPFQSSPIPSPLPSSSAPTVDSDSRIRMVDKIKDPQNCSELLSSSPSHHQTIIRSGRAQEIEKAKERDQKEAEKETVNECYNCRTLHASSWRKCTTHDEDGVFTIILCNPCGLWFVNKKQHRPRKYWGKMKDGRPIPPSKRGPRKKSDKVVKPEKPMLKLHDKPPGYLDSQPSTQIDLTTKTTPSLPSTTSSSLTASASTASASTASTMAPVPQLPMSGLCRSRPPEIPGLSKRPFYALTQSLQQPPVFNMTNNMAVRTTSLPTSEQTNKRPKISEESAFSINNDQSHSMTSSVNHFAVASSSPAIESAPMPSSPGTRTAPILTKTPVQSGTPFLQSKALSSLPPITPQKTRLTPNKKDKTPDFLAGLSPSRWLSAYLGSSRSPGQFSSHNSPVDLHSVNFYSEGDLFTESPFKGLCRSEPFNHSTINSMPPPSTDDDFNLNILPSSPSIFRMYKDNNDLFSSSSHSTEATSPMAKLQQVAKNSPDAHRSLEESEEIGMNTNGSR